MDNHPVAAEPVPSSSPVSSASLPRPSRRPLLFPPAAARPATLLGTWILPQILLFVINALAWDLASGEMNPAERNAAWLIFVGEVAAFLVGLGVLIAAWSGRRQLGRVSGLLLLLGAATYLTVALFQGERAIPDSLRDWILPQGEWIFKQFALVMPGALYGAFRFLCPDRENERLSGAVGVILAVISPFAVGFLMISASISVNEVPAAIIAPLYLAASTLMVAGVLRICASIYVALRRRSPAGLVMFTALLALILPVAGLILNARIPFPADFQMPVLYVLAVINGLALCLPNFARPAAHRAVWLLQCATFSFTLYFFAAFLPWLPIMPLAVCMMGLGLLIAVPSALFLLHGYRLLDGWRAEIRDGSRWLPTLLGIAAFAAGPVLLTGRILADRAALHAAMDFLSHSDYARDSKFSGSRSALRSALLRMRDFKAGRYLPYYSEFYNALAFDRLVLPNSRIEEIWGALIGGPLPEVKAQDLPIPLGFRRGRTAQEAISGPTGARPSCHATLVALDTSTSLVASHTVRARARLTVRNATAETTEFAAAIHVPDGVFITGMHLTIGNENVPARLFEQRAAEWVYQKITEVRPVPRDPAILRFTGPNAADLRIYPVEPGATRTAEIEFSYPSQLKPAITIADQPLELPPASKTAVPVAESDDASGAWIPAAARAGIPPLTREPEPCLVLDVSRDSNLREPEAIRVALARALAPFSETSRVRVFFANADFVSFRGGAAIPVRDLVAMDPAQIIRQAGPFVGGFLEVRAVKSTLAHLAQSDDESLRRFSPAIIVVRGSTAALEKEDAGNLDTFARLAPDVASYCRLLPRSSRLEQVTLSPHAVTAVHLVRFRERRFVVPADSDAFVTAAGEVLTPPAVWTATTGAFSELPAAQVPGFASAVAAWNLGEQRIVAPGSAGPKALSRLVALARTAGILVPGTALMVVENSAQWKMLERTEKKALGGHDALTLTESPAAVPEPSTFALCVVAILALLVARRLKLARPR